MLDISKQAVSQARKRQKLFDIELNNLVTQADIIRKDHPGCGVEKLYKILKPKHVGRDKFCEIFMDLGYRVRRIKNYTRTTIPVWFNYPNLIEGMMIDKPYTVLQSDITYFDIAGKFYYIVFIVDVYTREILGYNVDDNMRVQSNIKALKMALRSIPKELAHGIIHHSDRGSQYGSQEYLKLLKDNNILVSMGEKALDNAFVERVNGTIKNEYLKMWYIPDFKTLKSRSKKAVNNYNTKRLHMAFKNSFTPLGFKESLLTLDTQERPKVIIYADGNYKVKMALSHHDFNPRKSLQGHICPIVI